MATKKKATKKAKKTTKKGTKKAKKTKPRRKAAPKRKKAAPKKRKAAPRKKAAKKAPSKRKPNPAFMRAMTLSPDLGAVVGSSPIPRTEVTKKLWAYIKRNGLQDSVNRRMINADDKLQAIFGGRRQVSMFEMTKLVAKHMK
ncbi:MAG: SWIB/MDM2 domain-containing protein [Candidatus Zixiibacteriota bacterium]